MFCPYCKKEIEDDSLFCSFCGEKIETPVVLQGSVSYAAANGTNRCAQQKLVDFKDKLMQNISFGKFNLPVWGIVLAAVAVVVLIIAIASGIGSKPIEASLDNMQATVEDITKKEVPEGFEKTIQTEYLLAEEIHYDANGNISSHYMKTYDERGNLLKDKSIIENSWTEYEYDEHGERISEKFYRSNAQGETGLMVETEWDIKYAEDGNKQHVVEYWYGFDAQGNRTENKKIVYSYNKYGLLENVETTSSDEKEYITYTYNSEKVLTGSYTRNESNAGSVFVKDVTYNEAGNLTSDHTERQKNGNTVYMADSNYEYDAAGNQLRSESKISDNGKNSFLFTEYAYDSHNNMISAIYYVDGVQSSSSYWKFDYDKDGNTIYEKSVASDMENYYEYDSYGNLVKDTARKAGVLLSETVYTYDSNGNLLSEELIDYDIGGGMSRGEYMYDANNNLIRETSYLFGQYQGYTEYTYVPVDKVVYMPIADETPSASEGISGADSSSELGNDASEKKSPVGTWELIGTYYGWENEEELTQPVPLEKLSIWDGERITFTVYGDRIDFFGHVSKWSYENDEFRCSLETDYPQLGALYYVDENTMHYSLRGDIEVYKRVGNNTNNGTAAALPTVAQEKQAEWLKQIQALAYIAYDNMRGVGKATPEILLANPDGLRMYIYASTDYLFYDAWKKYDWDEAKRLIAFGDAFGAGCIADDYEAYIPENAIKEKLRNMFGSAAVEGFNFAGIFDNGFFHYEEGDPGDYLALSECEKTNWNDMSQIIFSYEYGYIEEDPDETLGNIIISMQADTTSPYGCIVKQIEWSK